MSETAELEVLRVRDLSVSFDTEMGKARAVEGVSFGVQRGRTVGIVGESGCGKSVTAMAIQRLLPKPQGKIDAGEILINGRNIVKMPLDDLYRVRGRQVAMIFQEPMTALNPVFTVQQQMAEVFALHFPKMSAVEVYETSLGLLHDVGIPAPEQRLKEYPHQLSGGMRQRVMIALALSGSPDLLIADEPTTALDVTIQAQILELMQDIQRKRAMSILLITHDLGVIAEMCDDVLVMYGGRIIETAPVEEFFISPSHPYSQGLLRSMPHLSKVRKTILPAIRGTVPSIFDFTQGCRFANRCGAATEGCRSEVPELEERSSSHLVACFKWRELSDNQGNSGQF